MAFVSDRLFAKSGRGILCGESFYDGTTSKHTSLDVAHQRLVSADTLGVGRAASRILEVGSQAIALRDMISLSLLLAHTRRC